MKNLQKTSNNAAGWYAHKHAAGIWSVARGEKVGVDFEYAPGGTMPYQQARKTAAALNAAATNPAPNAALTRRP